MGWLRRGAGVLVAPGRTLGRVVWAGEGGLGDALWLLLPILLVTAPLEAASAGLSAERSFLLALNKLVSLYLHFALAPLGASLAAGLLLAVALRLRGRGEVRVDGILAAAAFLWVPTGLLGMLGALLEEAGLALPWLPHLPLAAFLADGPSPGSILLRVALSYGWSLGLFVVLVRVALRPPAGGAQALPRPPAWAGWALAGLLAVGVQAGAAFAWYHRERLTLPGPGDRAVAFSLARADGQGRVSLAELAGQPVLLEFWADWCSICMAHMPEVARWAVAHPEVRVLAIHRGEQPIAVQAVVLAQGWAGPIFLADTDERVSTTYRADTLPVFFAVGPDGIIRAVHVGAPPAGWLDGLLDLGTPPPR
ncbi:MAG TPA: TlpA disulfide reductase family protein [Myxococcota bacterium]|nr:TlpA disulfide reductase family protein [Myxococcota bacterium]HRY94250.1 TlpA disulfide reductase family protein [Myxococcota bacterium]HSA20947.1 TlpA disulfide reductase family protein [Myxococcota bacterium]